MTTTHSTTHFYTNKGSEAKIPKAISCREHLLIFFDLQLGIRLYFEVNDMTGKLVWITVSFHHVINALF